MISRPRIGQRIQCWYRAALRGLATHHGEVGIVVAVARGPGPRNILVRLEGNVPTIVPCGNLRNPQVTA